MKIFIDFLQQNKTYICLLNFLDFIKKILWYPPLRSNLQLHYSLDSMLVAGRILHDLESNNCTFSEVTCEPLPRFLAQRRNSDSSKKSSVSTPKDQAVLVGAPQPSSWSCAHLIIDITTKPPKQGNNSSIWQHLK